LPVLKRKSLPAKVLPRGPRHISRRDAKQKITQNGSAALGAKSLGPVLYHLNKLLNSKALTGAAALKKLLNYLVMKVLRSEQQEIKEYSLGTEVFGRSGSFDPQVDTIVRVQVRRLRDKLREYYSKEGAGDLMHIQIPKGSYVPTFTQRYVDRPCPAGQRPRCRLAVLPFLVLNQDERWHIFASALAETLIDDFAEFGHLDVVSRTSAFIFKNRHKDVRQIAKHLNVDAILEGSVHHANGQLRLKIRLVNARTGFTVWSSRIDADADNVLKSEEEIAQSVVPVVKALLI